MPEEKPISVLDVPLKDLTPGMRQYQEVKCQHPDCLVMLRMGDFYEMFYADAVTAARELEITLTSRGVGEKKAPLAGVPFHALENYLGKLVKKGYKVALVEQLEDPKLAKGLVKRGLVRIVTPGTVMESSVLNERENNYIVALTPLPLTAYRRSHQGFSLAAADISTGEFFVTTSPSEHLLFSELARLQPSECIIPESLSVNEELLQKIRPMVGFLQRREDYFFSEKKAREILQNHFHFWNSSSSGLVSEHLCVSGALLQYLLETQKNSLGHLSPPKIKSNQQHMILDAVTIRNLELLKNARDGSLRGTLLSVLDKTRTPLGARLLKRWITQPLCTVPLIEQRLDAVAFLHQQLLFREEVRHLLEKIADLERLVSRINYGNATPRDLGALFSSLQQIPLIKNELQQQSPLPPLLKQVSSLPEFSELVQELQKALREDLPLSVRDGGIIRSGYSAELDQLHYLSSNSKKYLQELEEKERQKTGISTLKIGYTNVFGYFIEVTKKNLSLVPSSYIRKQTTANSERYVTEELKVEEEKILTAQEKILALEYDLFQQLLQKVVAQTALLQEAAQHLAVLDVLCSLAVVAWENQYCRPEFVAEPILQIKEGRHPVIELLREDTGSAKNFIANDLLLNEGEMMIITGPNMSGKCVVGDSIIYSNKGMLPIKYFKPANLPAGRFSPLSITLCGKEGLEKTSHFYYDGKKQTIKVTTRFGYAVEGTANHPILVRTQEGKEIWRELGGIVKTDFIILQRNINLWGTTTRIPQKIIQEVKSYQYNNKVKNYYLPSALDKDLAYVMGLLIGDGTLTYKNSIALSNVDGPIITKFYKIIKEKFNCSVKTKRNKADHLVHSKQIRLFLEKIGLDYKQSLHKEVPFTILQSPRSIVKAFLQGLFDTDGDAAKKYGNVSLSTSSYLLAQQVQLILLNFGIISSLKEKRTKRNMNYRVQIYGENAILFHKLIGFKLERKAIRKELASKLRMPNYGIPHLSSLLKEVQKRIVQKKNKELALKKVKPINSIFYTYLPKGRNISYKKLKELIEYCNKNKVDCRELKEIHSHNYFYDSIADIKKSSEKKAVYDFSLPKTHSFIANGLVSHNSTVMRQTALIVLLAHLGSFVPAEKVVLGMVDRIFTRVGASDDLSAGQSTFMAEMQETASILHHATERSLILLDEIGRGTSTFDGVSLAWSVAEHLHNVVKAKTLFATHYHVLNKLAEKCPRVKNYNVAAKEIDGDIVLLHKLVPGGTDQSFGIHVAKLAGLPSSVIQRAQELQETLQKDDEMMRKLKVKKLEEQMSLQGF